MKRNLLASAALVALVLLAGCPEDTTTTTVYVILPNPVQIEAMAIPDATVGVAFTAVLPVSGGGGQIEWMIEPGGTNDGWLILDDQGVLAGSPGATQVGAVVVIVRATDSADPKNFDIQTFSFNVNAPPEALQIATASLPDAYTGWAYGATLESSGTGGGDLVWVKMLGGTNDDWLTLTNGGALFGTPAAGNVGPVTLRVRLVDLSAPTLYLATEYSFNVFMGSLAIENTAPLPNAAAGNNYQIQFDGRGGSGNYIWALEPGGQNDAWLSMSATGALSGVAPATAGTWVTINVSLSDASNPNLFVQELYSFQIKLLAITTESLNNAFVGVAYAQTLAAQGGTGSVTWSIEPGGSNYAWLSFSGSTLGNATGPTANELGPVTVLVKASDGTNQDVRIFVFSVYDQLQLAGSPPDAFVNVAYSELVPVSGGSGDFVFSIQTGGTNDSWLSIDAGTGRLTGTPRLANLGAVQVVVRVAEEDDSAVYDQQTLSFQVLGVQITTPSIPDSSVGQVYSVDLDVTGGSGYYAWSITSGPAWLTINPQTGELSGTAAAAGAISISVNVYDSLEPTLTDSKTYSIWVVNSLVQENFDGGAAGWTFGTYWYNTIRDPNNTTYREYVGPYAAHSGTMVAGTATTGLPSTSCPWNSSYYLMSPSFTVPSTGNCYLTYWQWYQFEFGYMGDNDGGQLQYDLNGNNLWTPLTPSFPVGYPGTAGGQNAFVGFCVPLYDGGWQRAVVDLSSLAGNSVRIRWYHFADGDTMRYRGWFVDDVHIFDLGGSAGAPTVVTNPVPGDTWTYGVAQPSDFTNGVTLSWDGAIGAASYDVYVGTSASLVAAATTASSEFQGNQTGTSFSATGLSAGGTYYWRVDAVNTNGTTAGPVWSFTAVNPTHILINHVNTYGYYAYARFVELGNPSTTVHQDLSQYILNTFCTYTTGWPYLSTATLPNGLILPPDTCRPIVDYQVYRHYEDPYRGWDVVMTAVYYNIYYAYYQYEAWLQQPGGTGVDYLGVNVASSNQPSDLTWIGTLSQSSSYDCQWIRRTKTDTDNASDFRNAYDMDMGSAYGNMMGVWDAGQ